MTTVRELVQRSPLRNARLMAGGTGLDRRVTGVQFMELFDVPKRSVARGEMLLSTAYGFWASPDQAVRDAVTLVGRRPSGFVFKLRYVNQIPRPVMDAAERHAVPVFVLPRRVRLAQVASSVYQSMWAEDADPDPQPWPFDPDVSVGQLIETIAAMLGHPIHIASARGKVLHRSSGGGCPSEMPGVPRVAKPGWSRTGRWLFSRLDCVGNQDGWIVADVGAGAEHGEPNLRALNVARLAIAMRLSDPRYGSAADPRMFLHDFLKRPGATLSDRASALGLHLDQTVRVIAASARGATLEFLEYADVPPGVHTLRDNDDGVFFGLVPDGGTRLDETVAAMSRTLLLRAAKAELFVGISTPVTSWLEGPRYRDQALEAMRVGRELIGHAGTYHFEDAMAYRTLAESIVGLTKSGSRDPIAALDVQLASTIEAFVQTGFSISRTAAALRVHRNTVTRRLEQAEHALGLRVGRFPDNLKLQALLLAHRAARARVSPPCRGRSTGPARPTQAGEG